MKRILVLSILSILLFPQVSMAQIQLKIPYPISENLSQAERVAGQLYNKLSAEDAKEETKETEKKLDQQDPKKDTAEVIKNKGNPDATEFPPYGGPELREELGKKEPSIPVVEGILKKVYVYQSKTLNSESEQDVDKQSNVETGADDDGTLEKLQIQTIITYENARALSRRALDLMGKAEEDAKEMEEENKQRSSTGSMHKGAATSSIFRTHMMLNEIAVLRNSYIEVSAINVIQGVEAPKAKGNLISDALGALTGG